MKQVCSLVFALQLVSIAGASRGQIVGGRVSMPHSKPYMVSVQSKGRHICGGILIRDDFVLTAAHCKKHSLTTVVLGAHNISYKEETQQEIPVKKLYPHKKYKTTYQYDIMLIKLKTKARLNENIRTIRLPDRGPATTKCTAAGWGMTAATGPGSAVLKEGTEVLQSQKKCKKWWKEHFDSQHMLCTKNRRPEGVYQGDSGGPLLCDDRPDGLVSYTSNISKDPDYPHVFTKVQVFVPWIKRVMRGREAEDAKQ